MEYEFSSHRFVDEEAKLYYQISILDTICISFARLKNVNFKRLEIYNSDKGLIKQKSLEL